MGTSTDALRVELRMSSGAYQIRTALADDASVWANTNWFTITDAPHYIEVDWRASSAAGANDGGLTLWIDGTQQADLTGVDNDTWRVDRARLGALSAIDTGTSGTLYLDAFESRRSSYIGPTAMGPSFALSGGSNASRDPQTKRGLVHFTNYQYAPALQSGSLTFTPADDSYIESDAPTANHGSETTLVVDESPLKDFLLKFTVTGVNGQTVTNAKIRLYNTDAATKGGDFYQASSNSWQEGTVTWSNAPSTQGSMLASLGAVSAGTWYEVDVTTLVTGDGTYSLRIKSTSTNGADYSSKEGANAPELVVTLGGTPAPTNTPTPGPSPTPTNTPTPTATPVATNTPTPGPFSGVTFVYDGDGKRVKSVFNSTTTTYFVGNHYEVANGVVTKYYYAEKQRIAMRTGGALNYLLGDHLGSTSLTTDSAGNKISELRYKAWGEERYAFGSTATNYTYTGQYSYTDDFGLMYYGARWYDPTIGRFNQPDINIPGTQGVQAWDRYAYVNNNPLLYTDPSGNWIETAFDLVSLGMTLNDIRNEGMTGMNALMLVTDVASVVLPIVPAGVSHALRATKIAKKLANTADAAADTIKVVDKASDARTFYHATNAAGAKSILEKGIDLAKGRLDLDFNPAGKKGFYVTELLDQAKDWASKYGDDGRIVQFKVPKNKLDELSGKIFASGDSTWLDFVSAGRDGKLHHAYDYVEGPYLGLKTRQPYGHQLAIFTKKAVNLFNNSIFGIVR